MTYLTRCEKTILSGMPIQLNIKVNKRAKRIILKLNTNRNEVDLTLPSFISKKEGINFLHKNEKWLVRELSSLPKPVPFTDGVVLPFMGVDHLVRHRPGIGQMVWKEDKSLCVGGDISNLSKQLNNWLIKSAHDKIFLKAHEVAYLIRRNIKDIVIKDPKSLWASCGRNAKLSFSWRLILAPPEILNYVVIHEVCHLSEMNHSPKFWNLVYNLCPTYDTARSWLKCHGTKLHSFGCSK